MQVVVVVDATTTLGKDLVVLAVAVKVADSNVAVQTLVQTPVVVVVVQTILAFRE
jgi:hypothetical protein